METAGPKPYSQRDRIAFAATLDRILTRAIKRRDASPPNASPTDAPSTLEPPPDSPQLPNA
jgi:hypothetical protein